MLMLITSARFCNRKSFRIPSLIHSLIHYLLTAGGFSENRLLLFVFGNKSIEVSEKKI